jgi:hypothetical protein
VTVLAKPSATGRRGWRVTVPAALLCAIMISGCTGAAVSAHGSGSRDPGPSTSSAVPAQRACSPWAGLDDLAYITTWLRQLIGDEVLFGASTQQAKRDGLAVAVYADSLGALWQNLPAQYGRDLRDSVLSVAASPYKKTPEQLNTAANAAQSLATKISQLCF